MIVQFIKKSVFFLLSITLLIMVQCSGPEKKDTGKLRSLVDTVGFAHYSWQMDSLMDRIGRFQRDSLEPWKEKSISWRVCISPHDDYTYVGYLYPAVLMHVHTPLVIMFGVAHKARNLDLQDKIVLGTYTRYRGPWGEINVSPLREEILTRLDTSLYIVNDSMMGIEHSLEALLPFLQYYNRKISIIPVLVPYMSFNRMEQISQPLARAILDIMNKHNLRWGTDYSLVISTDAVHYGDEGWGENNFAFYGTDSAGLSRARNHEHEIISHSLTGRLTPGRIKKFTQYTVQASDYKSYKWTWCGRYSVPFGLLSAWYLQNDSGTPLLSGELVGYATSIDHEPIPVSDLNMGVTAPANPHHWVGYAAIGYQ